MLPQYLIADDNCPLKGKWKSNEKMTLKEMAKDKNLSKKQIELFSKDFFGKLIVEISCDEFTSYYEGNVSRYKYKLLSKDGNIIKIEVDDPIYRGLEIKTIEIKDDCYFIPVGSLGFREVFCRIE